MVRPDDFDPIEHPTLRSLRLGKLVIPLNRNGALTGTAPEGTANAYESGATIILQMASSTAGTWRTVTLS